MKTPIPLVLIIFSLVCFGLSPTMLAVSPPPDGGYPGNNAAEGQNALLSLTTGINNTAVGWFSLKSNMDGQLNTAVGAGTLSSTLHASRNTAIGGSALFSDTDGSRNTAVGALALYHNTTGSFNTAMGDSALLLNTTGGFNTANGVYALVSNTTGGGNTASGVYALWGNTTGNGNTAIGEDALFLNTTGNSNTAVGAGALHLGGDSNTALGVNAGYQINGNNNIDIGANVLGVDGESNTIRIGNTNIIDPESNTIFIGTEGTQTNTFIAGISGVTVAGGVGVIIDTSGHLGTMVSSERFKDQIKPMDKASEAILGLKPVSFRYRKEFDPDGIPQFGLVAEDVEKVNPDLVARDKEGKPYTVRYDAVNAMLLNEFLKEHRTVQGQQKEIDALKAELKEQAAQIQKVSAQLEASKPAPQVVNNP